LSHAPSDHAMTLCSSMISSLCPALVRLWFPYEVKPTAFARSVRGEIMTGLSETQAAVGTPAYLIGVVIVLPEAHGADLVHAAFAKGEVSAGAR
jgi:hypothetical protein